jgi:conjugative transfer region protein TrbK
MTRVDTALLVRFGAIAFAVIAVGLAAVQLGRETGRNEGGVRIVTIAPDEDAIDPLAAELARCRAITDPAAVDEACRRAWAERRARFFGQPEARP